MEELDRLLSRAVMHDSRTPAGYIPASVYQPYKDWDFGQKKEPSDWLTFCIARIGYRMSDGRHARG